MFKTFNDLVRHACMVYHIPDHNWTAHFITEQLKKKKLSRTTVVIYINWADGDCLSQVEIAKELNISRQAVNKHLHRLANVWPHLFRFGPQVPRFNTRRERVSLLGDQVV